MSPQVKSCPRCHANISDSQSYNDYLVCKRCSKIISINKADQQSLIISPQASTSSGHSGLGLTRLDSLPTTKSKTSKPYVCPYKGCDSKSYTLRKSFNNHARKHVGDDFFKCTSCGDGFSRMNELLSHNYTHIQRPYKCEICDQSFVTHKSLELHRFIHGEGSFRICEICGLEFAKAYALKIHKHIMHRHN